MMSPADAARALRRRPFGMGAVMWSADYMDTDGSYVNVDGYRFDGSIGPGAASGDPNWRSQAIPQTPAATQAKAASDASLGEDILNVTAGAAKAILNSPVIGSAAQAAIAKQQGAAGKPGASAPATPMTTTTKVLIGAAVAVPVVAGIAWAAGAFTPRRRSNGRRRRSR